LSSTFFNHETSSTIHSINLAFVSFFALIKMIFEQFQIPNTASVFLEYSRTAVSFSKIEIKIVYLFLLWKRLAWLFINLLPFVGKGVKEKLSWAQIFIIPSISLHTFYFHQIILERLLFQLFDNSITSPFSF
jgi:hypothetical protein